MDTLFKFTADEISFELEGSETYVLSALEEFLPYVRAAGGAAEEAAPHAPAAGEEGPLATWYRNVLPDGESPTMQDHILLFGYYLNRERKQFIFVPDDMKAAFREIGHEVPKSLLQILGSLKRDRGLLYSGDKRGEYSMTPAGLRHVESLLGLQTVPPPAPQQREDGSAEPEEEKPEEEGNAAANLFRHIDRDEEEA